MWKFLQGGLLFGYINNTKVSTKIRRKKKSQRSIQPNNTLRRSCTFREDGAFTYFCCQTTSLMQPHGGWRHVTRVVWLKCRRQFPLIILKAAMSSASPQTNTQPLWFWGVKAGSHLIRYSFSWLLRVPLSVTLLTHTAVRLSQPSFIPYIQLRRPDTVCSNVRYICVASRRVQPLVLIRKFCSFSVWAAPWADHRQPWAEMDKKRTSKELDHGSHGTVTFYSGIQFRCQWRLWLSFWSEPRCTF